MADERRADTVSRERLAVLETQMISMMEQHKAMAENIERILKTLSEARGGWKVMMWIGGGGIAVGAFLGNIAHFPWAQ
mgnify:CR=1 FL=1